METFDKHGTIHGEGVAKAMAAGQGPQPDIAAQKTAHVFEGQPDGRQSEHTIPTTRFRPRYRALTDAEKQLHDEIKNTAACLESLFEKVKPGRYRSLGMTALEEAVMWTVKELTA